MRFINSKVIILFSIICIFNINLAYSFSAPETFSDLAEELSPSVVNIATTSVVKQRQQAAPSFDDVFNFPFNVNLRNVKIIRKI